MKRKSHSIDVVVPVTSPTPITPVSKPKRRRQCDLPVSNNHNDDPRLAGDPRSSNFPHATRTDECGGELTAPASTFHSSPASSPSQISPSSSSSSSSSSLLRLSSSSFDFDFDGLCPAVFRDYLERVLPSQESPIEQYDAARGIVTLTFQDHGVRLLFRVPRLRRSTPASSPILGSPSSFIRAVLSTVTLHLMEPAAAANSKQQTFPFTPSDSPSATTNSAITVPPTTPSSSTLSDHHHRHHHHHHCFHAVCHHDLATVPMRQSYTGPLPPNLSAGHTTMAAVRAHSLQMGWALIGCDDGDDTWPDPSACNSASTACSAATASSTSTTTIHTTAPAVLSQQIVQPSSPSSPNSYSHEQRSFPRPPPSSSSTETSTLNSFFTSSTTTDDQHSSQRRSPIFERYSPKEGDFLAEVFYTDQDRPRITTVIFHRRRVVSEFIRANFQKRKSLYDQCFGEFVGIRQDIHAPYIDILIYKRKFASGTDKEQEFYTLITNGMSDIPMATPNTVGVNGSVAELVMYVREPHERYVHLLQYLACYPHEENTWLGHGHTISWPHKLHSASDLQHFLIATPILRQDRQFRKILSMDGAPVNLLWVLPITNTERNFKRARGTAPLLDLFSTSGEFHWILDERRKSLA